LKRLERKYIFWIALSALSVVFLESQSVRYRERFGAGQQGGAGVPRLFGGVPIELVPVDRHLDRYDLVFCNHVRTTEYALDGHVPGQVDAVAVVVEVAVGAVDGLASALFVHTYAQGIATPSDTLGLVLSIELIVAAILGGIGTITGAAVGGLFFFLVRTWLRGVEVTIPVVGAPVSELYFLIFALITLVFLFFMPQGILPRLLQESRRFGADDSGRDLATDGGRTPAESVIARLRDGVHALVGGDRR
jgi:hypothetical protein